VSFAIHLTDRDELKKALVVLKEWRINKMNTGKKMKHYCVIYFSTFLNYFKYSTKISYFRELEIGFLSVMRHIP